MKKANKAKLQWREYRTKEQLVAQADKAHAKFPQYKNHWSGKKWFVAEIRKNITTAFGQAFRKGDVVLAKKDGSFGGIPVVMCYSYRTRIDTSIEASCIKEVR